MYRIIVENKVFDLEAKDVLKSAYIQNIFTDIKNISELEIHEVSLIGFEHALNFMKNENYEFPIEYKEVLDFLLIDYTSKNLYQNCMQKCSIISCTRILNISTSLFQYEECPPLSRFCLYHKCHATNCEFHCMDYDIRESNHQWRKFCKLHKCEISDCLHEKISTEKHCQEHSKTQKDDAITTNSYNAERNTIIIGTIINIKDGIFT